MSDNTPSPWLRLAVFLLVSAAVVTGGWWFLQRQKGATVAKGAPPKGALLVKTAHVEPREFSFDLQAVGTVRAYESIDLSPNVTETITALHFNDGDFVKTGTLLAELSDAEERAMLASAKATLAEEEREINRLTALVKDGAAPEARLEERRTLATIAKQRIMEAAAKLADRRIVAPFDGWLGLRRISVGALVRPGTVIASLDRLDVVKIDFTVPETVLISLSPGTAITTRPATGDLTLDGKVSQIDTRVDPVTRSVEARAEVPNPDRLLRPGMLVTVGLRMQPRRSLSLPERALVPFGEKQQVFVMHEGRAKRTELIIGARRDGFVEILSGLNEGQEIITDGLVGIQDGMAVKVAGKFDKPVEAFNPEVGP